MKYLVSIGSQYDFCNLSMSGYENIDYAVKTIVNTASQNVDTFIFLMETDQYEFLSTLTYVLRDVYKNVIIKIVTFDSHTMEMLGYYKELSLELYQTKLYDEIQLHDSIESYIVSETIMEAFSVPQQASYIEPEPMPIVQETPYFEPEPMPIVQQTSYFEPEPMPMVQETAPYIEPSPEPIYQTQNGISSIEMPDTEVRRFILDYIKYKISSKQVNIYDETMSLMESIGLYQKDLKIFVDLGNCYQGIAGMQLRWDNLFGPKANVNINDHIRNVSENMKQLMAEKQNETKHIIQKNLPIIIFKQGDVELFVKVLDMKQESGLYAATYKERPQSYENLLQINRDTYARVQSLYEAAEKEKKGILGHREDAVADLCECVDQFLMQRKQIMEIECMIRIYDDALDEIMKYQYDLDYSTGFKQWEEIFEQNRIYDIFQNDFHRTFKLDSFLDSISISDLKAQLR